MRIKINTICLFLFVTIFISCKKEDLSDIGGGPGNSSAPVLNKVLIDNKSASEYVYNETGLLSVEKSQYEYTIYEYDAKNLLVSSKTYGDDEILSSDISVSNLAISQTAWVSPTSGSENGKVTYEYNESGKLIKSISTRASSTTSEYSVFTYDSNNRVSKQSMFWDDVATGYIDYAYDSKGNLLSESLYNLPETGAAELSTLVKYTYDSQSNPYKAYNKIQIPGINTNTNNILKETYTIHLSTDQGSDKIQVTENSYKYNAMGYPISQNDKITYVY
jgi:hypothetical protein